MHLPQPWSKTHQEIVVDHWALVVNADGWRFYAATQGITLKDLTTAGNLSRRTTRQLPVQKSPGRGTTGASAALPACRSDRRMCIVGGRNDAAGILRQFYLECNLHLNINYECGIRLNEREDGATVSPSDVPVTAGAAGTKGSPETVFRRPQ
jgi:hypothetical protein